ncbi:NCAIR mutase (PurE)-related protein [Catenulispora sp. GAS73]|uniref:nickel pincer cofactor biosynthesis protein LarB n=1 Tax=Catenulispora sp. GAS73 TaxID=3156269 RepID=UPI0035126B35
MTGDDGGRPRPAERIVELGDFAKLDVDRMARTGVPEVVFAESKTVEQTFAALEGLRRANPSSPALATRCPQPVLEQAVRYFESDEVLVDEVARTLTVGPLPEPIGRVAVVCAGTSDLPVARECLATLAVLGVGAVSVTDVGVAGIARLFAQLDTLRASSCVIVVAGMEGALAGVVAGLVAPPVIGVPTSVGYGVSAGGLVAAAAMLASCSPGLVTVNVDNGFGAAAHAAKIVKTAYSMRTADGR